MINLEVVNFSGLACGDLSVCLRFGLLELWLIEYHEFWQFIFKEED